MVESSITQASPISGPPSPREVVESFLRLTVATADLQKARLHLTKRSVAAGSFEAAPVPAGSSYTLGAEEADELGRRIPVSIKSPAPSGGRGEEMTVPMIVVEEEGQWKIDLPATMERLMGGEGAIAAAFDRAAGAMGAALGTALGGVAEALVQSLDGTVVPTAAGRGGQTWQTGPGGQGREARGEKGRTASRKDGSAEGGKESRAEGQESGREEIAEEGGEKARPEGGANLQGRRPGSGDEGHYPSTPLIGDLDFSPSYATRTWSGSVASRSRMFHVMRKMCEERPPGAQVGDHPRACSKDRCVGWGRGRRPSMISVSRPCKRPRAAGGTSWQSVQYAKRPTRKPSTSVRPCGSSSGSQVRPKRSNGPSISVGRSSGR